MQKDTHKTATVTTRRTAIKTAAVLAGTAAAQSLAPARLDAQTAKPTAVTAGR